MPKTILIVDDLPAMCLAMGRLLKTLGHSAPFATSADEAMKLLSVDPLPDLIVVDYMMPEVDGLQLLRMIRAGRRTAGIPVMMFSAYDEPQYRAAAMADGASGLWGKGGTTLEHMKRDIERLTSGDADAVPPPLGHDPAKTRTRKRDPDPDPV